MIALLVKHYYHGSMGINKRKWQSCVCSSAYRLKTTGVNNRAAPRRVHANAVMLGNHTKIKTACCHCCTQYSKYIKVQDVKCRAV
jgi:hypothetical protein